MSIPQNLKKIKSQLPPTVTLVAVSKTKPVADLMQAYEAGQRVFGENKIQEMADKWEQMPKDIQWHMIGHVQTNKVKYMAPFVHLIHGVDSLKLLKEINKRASQNDRIINCLLQIKIAEEDTKFGMTTNNALELLNNETFQSMENVRVVGLMGMATFTENESQLRREFGTLKAFFESHKDAHSWNTLSIGMSGDYAIAIAYGSTMVRIGSAIFGARNYT